MANQTEPRKVDLVEGKETSLGGGVTVRLKSVLYAHLANSQNNSLMVLEATRAGETKSVTLERLYPGPPKYTLVFGLKLAIDYVDAYHSPSTGAVLVLTE